MGQKAKPTGLRLGINRTSDSRWFADKNYGIYLLEDIKIRKYINDHLVQAGIAKVIIERRAKKAIVTIYASRPGVIIGKKGSDIDKLKKNISRMTNSEISLNIVEVRKPELEAKLVAENIAQQMQRRVNYRRAMKRAMQMSERGGAKGMRVVVSGRLGGAEIARTDQYREGRVPLHTLRADIDYGTSTAQTTYGTCGVKVWIFRGEILQQNPFAQDRFLSVSSSVSRS